MIRFNKSMAAILAFLVIAIPGMLWASNFSADITAHAIISNPDTQEAPRALLMFNLPDDFAGKSITSAKLIVPLSFSVADSDLANLAIWPIGTTWSPDNVSWASPWNQAGGDVADSSYILYPTNDPSSRLVEIDISGIATAWAQEWYPNKGLMLMLLQASRQTFQINQNENWDSGVIARVEISYEE